MTASAAPASSSSPKSLREKRNGYFIEFGASNGVALSNTYLLEKSYGWKGILAEPARSWLDDLKKNRNCSMDFRCLWQETGKSLEFNETSYPELSTINEFSTRADDLAQARTFGKKYMVETVSLDDLAFLRVQDETSHVRAVLAEGTNTVMVLWSITQPTDNGLAEHFR